MGKLNKEGSSNHNKTNIAHPNSLSILHNQQDNLIQFEEMSDNVKVSYDFLPVEIVTNILHFHQSPPLHQIPQQQTHPL